MHIDICICTHNPRPDVLARVITSIRNQQMTNEGAFSIVVVDNASNPPINKSIFDPFKDSAISTKLVHEPLPGIARARLAAAKATTAEWVLFVDDDNELNPNYISSGLSVIHNYPTVGCFGGKLLLPDSIKPPRWVKPFLPFLGIKDYGNERIERMSNYWGPWEPPTAGAFIHRDILQEFMHHANESENFFRLGRAGRELFSCEDSFLMRCAVKIGRSNSYEPTLLLSHHLAPHRFRFRYLMRLMYNYGVSHVVLDALLKGPQPVPEYYKLKGNFLKSVLQAVWSTRKESVPYIIGMVAYHVGARREHFSRRMKNKV